MDPASIRMYCHTCSNHFSPPSRVDPEPDSACRSPLVSFTITADGSNVGYFLNHLGVITARYFFQQRFAFFRRKGTQVGEQFLEKVEEVNQFLLAMEGQVLVAHQVAQ